MRAGRNALQVWWRLQLFAESLHAIGRFSCSTVKLWTAPTRHAKTNSLGDLHLAMATLLAAQLSGVAQLSTTFGWQYAPGNCVDGSLTTLCATLSIAAADVGIRALALLPMPTDRKAPGQTGVPVLIQGVWVRTGDMLYADEDGIVVMPAP